MDDTNSEILHEPTNDRVLIITHINTPICTNGSDKWSCVDIRALVSPNQTNDEYALPITHLSTESESANVKNVIHMWWVNNAYECMDDTNSEILHEPTNDRMLIITHKYPNIPKWFRKMVLCWHTRSSFAKRMTNTLSPRYSSVCVGSKMSKCFDHRHSANYYWEVIQFFIRHRIKFPPPQFTMVMLCSHYNLIC